MRVECAIAALAGAVLLRFAPQFGGAQRSLLHAARGSRFALRCAAAHAAAGPLLLARRPLVRGVRHNAKILVPAQRVLRVQR